MSRTRTIAMICLLLTSLGMLSACGTVQGFGHDVSQTGHAISRAAR